MEKDVVCGMQIDPAKAAGSSQYNGKTYYFCSRGCKAKFDANPTQYAQEPEPRRFRPIPAGDARARLTSLPSVMNLGELR